MKIPFGSVFNFILLTYLITLYSCLKQNQADQSQANQELTQNQIATGGAAPQAQNTQGAGNQAGQSNQENYGDLGDLLSGTQGLLGGGSGGQSEGSMALDDGSAAAQGGYATTGSGDPQDITWDPRFEKVYLTSYLNALRGGSYGSYMCPPYSFIVGQYSLYHQDSEGTEWSDRQYKLKCQYFSDGLGRTLLRQADSACVTATVESFPDNYKTVYSCPEGTFFSGHVSTYSGNKTIRNHTFSCCQLNHPDGISITFPKYEVYSLEHAGAQGNCKTEADATSYSRRYQWEYDCPTNSILYKVTMTNVPETSNAVSYTEFDAKPQDAIFGFECCQVGVQQSTDEFIYGFSQSQEDNALPYELFPKEEEAQ